MKDEVLLRRNIHVDKVNRFAEGLKVSGANRTPARRTRLPPMVGQNSTLEFHARLRIRGECAEFVLGGRMAKAKYQETELWKRTLAPQRNDEHAEARELLRTTLAQMRENVIPFVRRIHQDVLGLTVHDESHLDALWETADEICGPEFQINPVEAFAFGAAVLLHDTAMSVAAYPEGLTELKQMDIWKDLEVASAQAVSDEDERKRYILFNVLRQLHASQAEKLATFTFHRPNSTEAIPLLENTALRDALASTVGRIAHSHHWNPNRLLDEFNSSTGAPPACPAAWTLNEVKVACLLRCADAAHLDARRAPTMLYAISDIRNESLLHWTFQNKLNKVTRDGEKLIFNSGQPFTVDDAQSWWLCFETLRMVDREIKASNAVLDEISHPMMAAKSVAGVESPQLASRYIRVSGWKPVDAEVAVSDPVQLARSLGGRDLYGPNHLAPIRELLQNAADAIRARRTLEDRPQGWGEIRVTLHPDHEDHSSVWLHVDDNGTGMSERVLTGPLIDFGQSLWSSHIVQEEFPGLISRGHKPIGKFGIGFFSIFLLGEYVNVISKKYIEGASDAKALVFDGLVKRPLLRPAVTGELPVDFSTRISVKLSQSYVGLIGKAEEEEQERKPVKFHIDSYCRNLVSALDIDVFYDNRISKNQWKHSHNWTTSENHTFVSEVYCALDHPIGPHNENRLTLITDGEGNIFGRAAYLIDGQAHIRWGPYVSVGGFVIQDYRGSVGLRDLPRMIGVIAGVPADASRNWASVDVPQAALAAWATEQVNMIDQTAYRDFDLVQASQELFIAGADTGNLPFCYLGGRISSWQQLEQSIRKYNSLIFPLEYTNYGHRFNLIGIFKLPATYFANSVRGNVISTRIDTGRDDFLSEDERRDIYKNGSYRMSEDDIQSFFSDEVSRSILRRCTEIWGGELDAIMHREPIDLDGLYSARTSSWAVVIRKREQSDPKN